MENWEFFDENFDMNGDGGALYVCDDNDGDYEALGVRYIDGGNEYGQHYCADICKFVDGRLVDDIIVHDKYDAAEVYLFATDRNVIETIGWYDEIEDAIYDVEEYVGAGFE